MAKSGGQIGNNNATKGKRLSSVLQKRMEERKDEDKLMNVLLDKALEGDLPAIKEVFDRIDGKAKQSIDIADVSIPTDNEERRLRIRELQEKMGE